MDKRKIDQDVYERYVDASVALFMECYCATLSEDIRRQVDQVQADDLAFPAALDVRCRSAIKKEYAVRKRKQSLKSIAKGLRYAASFAIVLLALASVLFISVEAIRIPIINYYISLNDEYLEIGAASSANKNQINGINWDDPLNGLIPDGYMFTMQDVSPLGEVVTIYDNQHNGRIFFSADRLNTNTIKRIDSENAQKVREFQCLGHHAVLVKKDGVITVAWGQEPLHMSFTIRSSALTESEIISIAEEFIQELG